MWDFKLPIENEKTFIEIKIDVQSNLDYPDLDNPDFSGPNLFMNIC